MDVLQEADRLLGWSERLLGEAAQMTPFRTAQTPVSVQRASANRKLAPQRVVDVDGRNRCEPVGPYVSSTYVAIASTCPSSCPYNGHGCYAQAGMAVRRLDRLVQRGSKWTTDATIAAEVEAIDGMFVHGVPQDGARGGRDLRLHVSGDAGNTRGARALAGAAGRWRERRGGAVWTFTHLWREIPREAWGPIAVLASVETRRDALDALDRGYAPALTVDTHDDDQAATQGGVKLVPCPAQTRGRTCAECRLCLDPELAARRTGVTFALHGRLVDQARTRLRVVGQVASGVLPPRP